MAIAYPEMTLTYDGEDTTRRLARVIAERFAGAGRTVKLLDVGSHAGKLLCDLLGALETAGVSASATALEPDEQAFAGLCDTAADFGADIRPFNLGVGEVSVRFAGSAFDVVLATHSLYYFGDWPAMLGELRERLAVGGLLLVTLDSRSNPLYRAVTSLRERLPDREPGPGFVVAEDVALGLDGRGAAYRSWPVASRLAWSSRSNLVDILAFFGRLRPSDVAAALPDVAEAAALLAGEGDSAGFAETVFAIER